MKKTKQEMHLALQDIVDKYEKVKNNFILTRENKAAIFNIDMINDFAFTSAFKNPYAVEIIPKIAEVLKKAHNMNEVQYYIIYIFHVIEAHTKDSVEFLTFPPHGEIGTQGGQIVDDLKEIPYDRVFHKNSTNGIHINDVKKWVDEHPELDVIIVNGVLADICAMQFAVGIKTYCNQINRNVKVIVPMDLVETYEKEGHNRDLFYYMALEFMSQTGIEIVRNIDFE